jgi:hypothetical protein
VSNYPCPFNISQVPVAQSRFALPKTRQIRKCRGCGQSGHTIKTCPNGAGTNSSHRKRTATATTAAPPSAPEADEAIDYGSGDENEDEGNKDEEEDNLLQGNNNDDNDDEEEENEGGEDTIEWEDGIKWEKVEMPEPTEIMRRITGTPQSH